MNYDLIIIGAGPAGLTAGLYGSRAGLKTLVLEKAMPGGQAALTERIENYPGYPQGVGGPELMMSFMEQATRFGVEYKTEEVTDLQVGGKEKFIETSENRYMARTLILAPGAHPRFLGIPGEKEFHGRGVSYCATCDGAFFPNKKVAVVGGGDSAVEEAIFLTKYAREVVLVHRRDRLRAARVLQERIQSHPKVRLIMSNTVEKISGKNSVENILLRNVDTGETAVEEVDGVFVFVGYVPNTSFLRETVDVNDQGYIITSNYLQTSVPGVFAAGDARVKFLRQVSTAVGDGAEAAMAAERYIAEHF